MGMLEERNGKTQAVASEVRPMRRTVPSRTTERVNMKDELQNTGNDI